MKDGSDRQRVNIVTGLSDGVYVEVKSGLSAGDIVVYIKEGTVTTEAFNGLFPNPAAFQQQGE